MREVTATNLRRELGPALKAVLNDGQTVHITRHGKVVAILAPAPVPVKDMAEAIKAFEASEVAAGKA